MECRILFLPSERQVHAAQGSNLLEVAREAGLPVASSCGADGVCGRCGLQIIEGTNSLPEPSTRETRVKERNRIDPKLRLACMLTIEGDLVVTAPYW